MYELILIPVIFIGILLDLPRIMEILQVQVGNKVCQTDAGNSVAVIRPSVSGCRISSGRKKVKERFGMMSRMCSPEFHGVVLSGRFVVWLFSDENHNAFLNYNSDS